jgi:N-acetylmuramoyl-L-alanine amidase
MTLYGGPPPTMLPSESAKLTVVVDPGHGGSERGACSSQVGVCEKSYTLHLAYRVKSALEEIPGVRVVLTRRGDEHVSLYDRSVLARQVGAKLFISLHANASPNGDQQGFEVFVYPHSPLAGELTAPLPEDPGQPGLGRWHVEAVLGDLFSQAMRRCSVRFGTVLLEEMEERLRGRPNRGLKQKALGVLARLRVTGVLVEVGFLNHPSEGRLLLRDRFQTRLIESLKSSLTRWLRDKNGHRDCSRDAATSKHADPPSMEPDRDQPPMPRTGMRHAPWHMERKELDGLLVWRTRSAHRRNSLRGYDIR